MNKPGNSTLAPISRDDLAAAVATGASINQLCKTFGRGSASVRHWLKKHSLKTVGLKRDIHKVAKACQLCDRPAKNWLCMSCTTRVRRFLTKTKAVALLGGACKRCDWSGPIAGFDFHHLHGKDFTIGSAANKSWDVVVLELKKCELLCATCHGIEHSKHQEVRFTQILRRYQGDKI